MAYYTYVFFLARSPDAPTTTTPTLYGASAGAEAGAGADESGSGLAMATAVLRAQVTVGWLPDRGRRRADRQRRPRRIGRGIVPFS